MKKHQKLDLVKKFRPSETISRQNIASKIESLSDRRGRKIKKKKDENANIRQVDPKASFSRANDIS